MFSKTLSSTLSSRFVATFVVTVALALSGAEGCGPSKKPPKEMDVSPLPPAAVASFRREQPNAVILAGEEDGDHNWRLKISSPRREKKTYVYTPQGDLVRKY